VQFSRVSEVLGERVGVVPYRPVVRHAPYSELTKGAAVVGVAVEEGAAVGIRLVHADLASGLLAMAAVGRAVDSARVLQALVIPTRPR
jgi:hypothetical protein